MYPESECVSKSFTKNTVFYLFTVTLLFIFSAQLGFSTS